jgi:hypothetical protein
MYDNFSSGGRLGRTKLPTIEDGTTLAVAFESVGAPRGEKVEKMEPMKVAAGSKGPIGGRENFWRRAWA